VSSALFQSVASDLWSVFLIILFFGGSIFVHELGHFLVARRRGVHVERFSIGFGPKIFAWRGKDGVEYRLSWLPLGGYVALPQLADLNMIEGESRLDLEKLPPLSYATKMLVFFAGAFFNVLFAVILAVAIWLVGYPELENITTTRIGYVLPKVKLPDGTEVQSPAAAAGLRVNDVIRAVDDQPVSDWLELRSTLILGTDVEQDGQRVAKLTIERNGATLDVVVHPLRLGDERMRGIGITAAYEVIVDKVAPRSPAEQWGLRAGDRLQRIDETPVASVELLSVYLSQHPEQNFRLTVLRDGATISLTVPARVAGAPHAFSGVEFATNYRLLYQTPWTLCSQIIETTFRTLWSLLHPRGDVSLSNLSGPIGIGVGFWRAAQSDYPVRFAIWFAVLLNLNLAIFNLLPVPVLDGGHMLFATIGRLRGRALPASFIMTAQSVFIVLLFSLILYVSFFDVRRIVRDVRTERAETQQPAAQPETAPAAP
jgi:regulator of sigma E protease